MSTHVSASTTFLFDTCRTGRTRYAIGISEPRVIWRKRIPNFPPRAPESTPIFDTEGNIYFGCHDHNFYSLDREGNIRWVFAASGKVYSSPCLADDNYVVFASGRGYLYCLDLKGNLVWARYVDIGTGTKLRRGIGLISTALVTKKYMTDQVWRSRCWASPLIDEYGRVYITSYGRGLQVFDLHGGELLWQYNLGWPRHHLSGVALWKESVFVASQQRCVHCLTADGKLKWKSNAVWGSDSWGNPSIDVEHGNVIFVFSKHEKSATILAYSMEDGEIKWHTKLPGGIRGTAALSYDNYLVVCCFDGNLYFLRKSDGVVLDKIRLSSCIRACWTTPAIDPIGRILVTVKTADNEGSIMCIEPSKEVRWELRIGKALNTPVVDENGRIYVGDWNGEFLCIQT